MLHDTYVFLAPYRAVATFARTHVGASQSQPIPRGWTARGRLQARRGQRLRSVLPYAWRRRLLARHSKYLAARRLEVEVLLVEIVEWLDPERLDVGLQPSRVVRHELKPD